VAVVVVSLVVGGVVVIMLLLLSETTVFSASDGAARDQMKLSALLPAGALVIALQPHRQTIVD